MSKSIALSSTPRASTGHRSMPIVALIYSITIAYAYGLLIDILILITLHYQSSILFYECIGFSEIIMCSIALCWFTRASQKVKE